MIPANAKCFFKDGDKWCCVLGDFINLQESPAGFGDGFMDSMESLGDALSKEVEELKKCVAKN